MPKVSPIQTSFNGGEFSPLLYGRVDADRYKSALAVCQNYLPAVQGPLVRRSGTKYVAEVKDSSKSTRLVSFEFSTTQAYILEFGNLYIRFYKDNGQIVSGTPVEVVTPYVEADLFNLKFTQSADVLYITHPSYAPRKLTRTSHTSWTLTTIDFQDGPYLAMNTTTTTLQFASGSGSSDTCSTGPTKSISNAANNGAGLIRITSAAHGLTTGTQIGIDGVTGTTEANGSWTVTVITANTFDLQGSTFTNAYVANGTIYPKVFVSTDVGRHVRFKSAANSWAWMKVAAFTHYGKVTVEHIGAASGTAATTTWRLGLWSDTTGYPGCVAFHEDRLMFAGATAAPQRLDGSKSGDYENFEPSAADGTIADSNSISFSLNSNDVNVIRWLTSDEKGLLAGSVGGEWVVRPSSQGEAISPTNISAKRTSSGGSANIQPIQAGKAAIFVQRAGRKVLELSYFLDKDGFEPNNLTELSEHITQGGIKCIAYQKQPQPTVWCVRNDGVVAAMTYERTVDNLHAGWSRHILGGYSDAANSDAIVESVAAIPSSDGSRDEVWFIVKRYINGSTKRYVEYLTKTFEDTDDQKDAFFVDCGLTYDSPLTITGITKANPGVVTSVAHGLSNGDVVLLSDILGMTELNDVTATVANATANTFELSGLDTSSYTTYVSGGYARKYVTTISGLSHLEGQSVSILGDGAVQPSKTVSGGAITLSTRATTVQIGLSYNSDAQMLRIEAGAADGTALGKTRRIHRVSMLLHRTLGLKLGMDFDDLDTIVFRSTSDELSRAVPLYSGIISESIDADYDFDNQIAWRQDQPLPGTFLAVMPQMETQDR